MRRFATLLALLASAPAATAQVLPFARPLIPDSVFAQRKEADSLERRLGLNNLDKPMRTRIDSLRKSARLAEEVALGTPVLSLVASGGLKGFNSVDTTREAGSASGALGLRLITSYAQYTALVNVVAQDPVVRDDFAGALLSPGNGTRGVVLDYQRGWKAKTYIGSNTPPRRWGMHLLGALSSADWSANDSTRRVMILSASARWTIDLFRAADTTKGQEVLAYGLRFDVGPTLRYVDVDGLSPADFRDRVLGNRSSVYIGAEAGLTLLVGYFVATARLTGFPDFGVGPVSGLTGLRFSSSLALQAPLVRLPARFR